MYHPQVTCSNPMTITSDVPSSLPAQSKDFGQSIYSLQILQQPRAARACRQSDRDRRLIDPPIIIKLTEQHPGLTTRDVSLDGDDIFIVTCKLLRTNGDEYKTLASKSKSPMRRENRPMLGQDVCTGLFIGDSKGSNEYYFWFPDLSFRLPGQYRLKFTGVKIIFRVKSVKYFEGYERCSELTKWLKSKGAVFPRSEGKRKRGNDDGNHDTPSSGSKPFGYLNQ